MDEDLLESIKLELGITWKDDNTDKKIIGFINKGKSYLMDIAGVDEIDFTKEGLARSLLFDYCRYRNSNAIELFEENFRGQLVRLNNKYQAEALLKEESEANGNKE